MGAEPRYISLGSAPIFHTGWTQRNIPGYYFQINGDRIDLGGGAYFLEKNGLYAIRSAIKDNLSQFDKLVKSKSFVDRFKELQGERNKRLPKEFQELMDKQPLIANKHFYYNAELPTDIIYDENCFEILIDHYSEGHKINSFFSEAMSELWYLRNIFK